MAVMGRKKQMVRTIILNRRSKEKESIEGERRKSEEQIKSVSEEEHQDRLKKLKEIGLIK